MKSGESIREARLRSGYTQVEVSKKLKVTQQAVTAWESGKAEPRASMLVKLAKLYDTSVDSLLGLDSSR